MILPKAEYSRVQTVKGNTCTGCTQFVMKQLCLPILSLSLILSITFCIFTVPPASSINCWGDKPIKESHICKSSLSNTILSGLPMWIIYQILPLSTNVGRTLLDIYHVLQGRHWRSTCNTTHCTGDCWPFAQYLVFTMPQVALYLHTMYAC